jgi:hypothetical protein
VEEEEPRRTTPVGLAVVGLVVVANAVGGVGPGTTGNALVVTVSVAIYCVSAVVFLLFRRRHRLRADRHGRARPAARR